MPTRMIEPTPSATHERVDFRPQIGAVGADPFVESSTPARCASVGAISAYRRSQLCTAEDRRSRSRMTESSRESRPAASSLSRSGEWRSSAAPLGTCRASATKRMMLLCGVSTRALGNSMTTRRAARLRSASWAFSAIAIAPEGIAQRFFQRPEPGRKVPPLIEPLPVDRPAHLFGARRTYATPGLVELDARGLELESAVAEDSPHAALEILAHLLMQHSQNASRRQHGVPVRHELEVGTVVARHVVDAVSEFLASRIELLEVTEAAGHRLAARIDDHRVRQHEVNEADVAPVVWHLVDEPRPAVAIDLRVAQILLAERMQLVR